MGRLVDAIEGVTLTPLRRIAAPGGDVLHALKSEEASFVGFGEAYFSTIYSGALKGWKRHKRIQMNIIVPSGAIAFLVRDEREGSPTCGAALRAQLGPATAETYQRLTVAPDLWMAFTGVASDTSMLLNIASLPHDPEEAENRPLAAFDTTALRALR